MACLAGPDAHCLPFNGELRAEVERRCCAQDRKWPGTFSVASSGLWEYQDADMNTQHIKARYRGLRGAEKPSLRAAAGAGLQFPTVACMIGTRTFPQNWQLYLECWLTSIFLIILRRDAPYRVPYLPTMPTFLVRLACTAEAFSRK